MDRTAWRSRVQSGVNDFEERRIKQKEERRQKRKECQNPAPQPDPAHSFPCPQCNHLFRERIGLISHLRTHPHTSEVMVISEDGGRTSSSSSCIYTLKSMKNEGLSFLFSFLLRYTFHRCCGSSGIAKYVYQPITSQMLNSNPNYNGSFNSKHVRAVSVISNH